MSLSAAELLYLGANLLLCASSFAVAALIVAAMTRGRRRRFEPVGLVFCAVFLAIGVRAAVRLPALGVGPRPDVTLALVATVDWVAALAVLAFLACRRRFGVFIESASMVREYATEYAEKEREARALAQVNEELRRLDQLKSEFLSMVSHELRTPLTAIIGYSRLLTRQVHGPLSPKQLEHQEAIFRSAQRLTDLINDLLDVSRLEAGRVELRPRPIDAKMVIDQVLSVVSVAAHAKQIALTNAVAAELPRVNADPARLQQVLVNLLGNAVKFTPPGGSVKVQAGRHKDHVWIAVEDTGVGIAADELARIWDPFYQVESPMSRRHGGSGLGLAIVRRLVELHGGLVRAESEGLNRGSQFTFTLPIATEPAVLVPVEAGDVWERVLAGRHVLIVEDEQETQDLMRVVVQDMLGGRATLCGDGEQAVAEALEHPPDLVLLDLMLPGMSGWEVARRLRQSPRATGVVIIAVSALARPQERETALHAGCDAYVAKPFLPEELARVISVTFLRQGVSIR